MNNKKIKSNFILIKQLFGYILSSNMNEKISLGLEFITLETNNKNYSNGDNKIILINNI